MSLNVGILAIQGDVQENLLSTKKAFEELGLEGNVQEVKTCLLYTSPSPRDRQKSRMPSSA